MLLVGYLEGIGSERGIAWRCGDSISLREFLGYGLERNPPEHSGLSKTRKRLSVEAHAAVFSRVLEVVQASGLLSGKTLGVDSTTLEANAAMRSIVRRDDGKGYEEWLEEVARASGIDADDAARPREAGPEASEEGLEPGVGASARPGGADHEDEGRQDRPGAQVRAGGRHGDRRVVAVTVQTMEGGDTASLPNTLDEAQRQLAEIEVEPREVVADKGYHSNQTMTGVQDRGLRSYVSEPNRGRRKWKRNRDAQKPTYDNRPRGKELLRQRGEKVERGFAHLLVTGGLRRVHVRGREEIRKRILIQAAASTSGFSCASGTALAPRAVCRASPRRKRRSMSDRRPRFASLAVRLVLRSVAQGQPRLRAVRRHGL